MCEFLSHFSTVTTVFRCRSCCTGSVIMPYAGRGRAVKTCMPHDDRVRTTEDGMLQDEMMGKEHVCSLCHRASPKAVCAWCGMVTDLGVAIEEAKEMAESRSDFVTNTRTVQFESVHQRARLDAADSEVDPESDVVVSSLMNEIDLLDMTPPKDMCLVPSGVFQFGVTKQVRTLTDYFIDEHPVTNREYSIFISSTGHRSPRYWSGKTPPADKEDHPVVGVTLEDAKAYAAWIGKDLPTEEEWEKAARNTDGRIYPWGDMFSVSKSNVSGTGIKDTSPVSQFPEGASAYGCLDMAGNVWEWTKTTFQNGSVNHTLKGGSWYDFSTHARCASRFSAPSTYEGSSVGFRCVYRPGDSAIGDSAIDSAIDSAGDEGRNRHSHPRVFQDGEVFQVDSTSSPQSSSLPEKQSTNKQRTNRQRLQEPELDGVEASGPLMELVENTMGALDQFNVTEAKARIEEVFEVSGEQESGEMESFRFEPEPEHEMPLPEGRMWRFLRPGARGIQVMLPWCYRVGNGIDVFFKVVPRWVSALLILFIPLLALGLVFIGTDRTSKDREEAFPDQMSAREKPEKRLLVRSMPVRTRQEKPVTTRSTLLARPGERMLGSGTPEASSKARPEKAIPSDTGTRPSPVPPPGMVYVPEGEFLFGRDKKRTMLPAFFIDRCEVTNLQYQKFILATKYPCPGNWKGGQIPQGLERHPVTFVDHADSCAYAKWAGKRLLTEKEWEKAARGSDGWIFPWGNTPDTSRANLFQPRNQTFGTREVGTMVSGESPFHCQDMAGNVLEWTSTSDGTNYVLKGGSWGLSREGGACHHRYAFFPPETRTNIVGFRCGKDLPKDLPDE